MRDLPEKDLNLSPHFKSARRFLHWLNPADAVEHYQANERASEVEQKRSTWTFVVQDDAVIDGKPRGYRVLGQSLSGTFDQHATRLAEANIENRVAVCVQLDTAHALIAHYAGTPEHGQGGRAHGWEGLGAVQPSIRLSVGHDRQTWVWLFDGELSAEDRAAIGAVLADRHGAKIETGTTALIRVPGYYARDGQPFQVTAYGAEHGGMKTRRYSAGDLRQVFIPPAPVPVKAPPPTAIGRQSQAEEAELRKRRVGELVSKGLSIEQATEHMLAERELQQRLDSIAARIGAAGAAADQAS
jgi:hypothetical protein